jgi:hypothetical protein
MRDPFVGGEGGLVVAVEASAVVDVAVGAFEYPTSWLGNESTSGFGPDTMSRVTPALVAASAAVVPVYRLSRQTWVMVGARRLALRSGLGKAVRSWTLAGVTTAATRCPGGVRQVGVMASPPAAVGLGHMTIDGEPTLRQVAAGRGVCRWGVECSPVR